MANFAYLAIVYFMSQLPTFLVNFHTSDTSADFAASSTKLSYIRNDTEEFDYVIVGAGAAGAVVAARLAATGRTVLLLERGGTPTPLASVPVMWLPLVYDPACIVRYPTAPQANLNNRTLNPPAASVLGGGSTANAMYFIRGSPAVFDRWAGVTGDSAWSWNRVLPYFKRSEDYHGVFSVAGGDAYDPSVHGKGGPLHIEAANLIQPSNDVLFAALQEKGLQRLDLNANLRVGYQPADMNMKKGRRCSTYEGYLKPAMQRSNLAVYSYATATKIHFQDIILLGKTAVGVTYTRHGATRYVKARREVIVSAGAFESPKLLLLSGVGPRDELAALGIESQVNLPVGRGLQDHLAVSLSFVLNSPITWVPERDLTPKDEADYFTSGYGPFHNDGANYGFVSTPQNGDASYPDIQFFVNHQTGLGSDPVAAANNPPRPDTNSVSLYLVKPESTGSLRLSANNPSAPLVVDPGFGSAPGDISRHIAGMKFIVDLYENSTAYAGVGGAKLVDNYFPCGAFTYRSDAYWDCVARSLGSSAVHFVGTNRMGKARGDSKAVVDSQLRVLGVNGLRVVDASVMPVLPNANTHAATVMVAERASDFIIWGL